MYLLIFDLLGNSNSRFLAVAILVNVMNIFQNANSILDNFCAKLINKNTEPKVWQKCDRQGNIYWLVFNPITGFYSYFSSEQEVRIWIEERYYYRP